MNTPHATIDHPDARPALAPVPETSPTDAGAPRGVAGPYLMRLPVVLLVVGILLQAVDTLLAKSAFDVIVNENETISLLIALAVAGIGAHAAVKTGIAVKDRSWIEVGLIGSLWMLIGVAMALLRFNTGLISGLDENLPSDMVVALLMLVLYLAAGGGIISATQKVWDPRYRELWSSRRGVRRTSRTLGKLESEYTRLHVVLGQLDGRRDALAHQANLAEDVISTHAKELTARARLQVGERLADPSKTSLYRQPVWEPNDGGGAH